MIDPSVNPNTTPITNINGITTAGLAPFLSKAAEAVEVKAIMPPTERSIPPVRITSVIPIETNSKLPLLMNRLKKAFGFCMAGYI